MCVGPGKSRMRRGNCRERVGEEQVKLLAKFFRIAFLILRHVLGRSQACLGVR